MTETKIISGVFTNVDAVGYEWQEGKGEEGERLMKSFSHYELP